MQHF
jgi:hypothetical protein